MFGIPTFDLLTDTGKQSFVEYVVNLMRNEIVSYTSSYINSATNVTVDLTPYATIAMLTAHEADTTNVHGIVDTSVLATQTDVSTAVSTHSSDTTSVHGIADTSALATQTDVSTAVSTHASVTTSVHGISNTANLVYTNDSRLSDARTPTGAAGGVLSGTYPNPGFAVDMATQTELDTHTTASTSVHGITNTANLVYTNDSRLTDARTPTGAAGGVLSGTYPNPSFAIKPVPSGALMPFAGSTAPTGWLLCFGQTLNATTNPEYADLYAVIGTTYGGSSISSFNLPDLRGRISVGLDSNSFSAFADRITTAGSNLNSRTLGATGGNQSMQQHSHSVTDPGHGHGVYDPGHVHNYWYITSLAGYGLPYPYYGNAVYSTAYGSPMGYSGTGISIAGNSTGISIQNTGGGTTSSQNVQPSIILNYIIKY